MTSSTPLIDRQQGFDGADVPGGGTESRPESDQRAVMRLWCGWSLAGPSWSIGPYGPSVTYG
jgi:hypothetical protein